MAAALGRQLMRKSQPFLSHASRASRASRAVRTHTKLGSGLNGAASVSKGDQHGGTERVVNLSDVLSEVRQLSPDLVFEDFDPNEPAWQPPPPIPEDPNIPTPVKPDEAPPPEPLSPALNPLVFASAYSPEQGFKELTVQQVHGKMQTGTAGLILDVRERHELEEYGTLAGAMHVPLADVSTVAKSGKLDDYRDSPVIVICAAGIRSAQATVRLTKVLGFKDVTNMQGGVYAWMDAGLPMVRAL